jgi:hypothetical protein
MTLAVTKTEAWGFSASQLSGKSFTKASGTSAGGTGPHTLQSLMPGSSCLVRFASACSWQCRPGNEVTTTVANTEKEKGNEDRARSRRDQATQGVDVS